ncbi:MAG TPA: efflux transporter outer membrane subunit [Steroidobacteraceae bacterium]|jgi:NodT family efflux transporter outer membrane factor (OMF) lipoprotein|nr:efflux transporter outer membrane subunit [Steroidobacteraceae bacterium]
MSLTARVALIASVCLAGLAGCAVGPNFQAPAAPAVSSYGVTANPTAATRVPGGEAQRFLPGQEVSPAWWRAFNSSQIDALVGQALDTSPDLQAARAALRAAQETLAAQRSTLLPALALQASSVRQHDAATLSPTLANGTQLFSLNTAQLTFDYPLDLFGGERRQIETLAASADAQHWQVAATYLTLTSNIVIAAINEAAADSELQIARQVADSAHQSLSILQRQYQLGAVSQSDVDAQQATLSQALALAPPLEQQRQQQEHLLAALTGRLPGQLSAQQTLTLDALALPQSLPLSLPASIVERRPDIRMAEAQLHAATAQVGVAIANMLPNISLTANAGSAALALSQLAAPATRFWSLGGTLSQTLFAGGSLVHRKRAAVATMDQAAAQYRSTVLQAFRQVADALAALQADAATLQAQSDATAAASRTLQSTQRDLQSGAASDLALLEAERAYREAVLAQASARAARLTDTVNLFVALGGGLGPAGELSQVVGARR